MTYAAEISIQNPLCVLFLVEHSEAMAEPWGYGEPSGGCTRAEAACTEVNAALQNLVIRCTGGAGIRHWLDIGVLGYAAEDDGGPNVISLLGGPLLGRDLVPITEIGDSPLEMVEHSQSIPDEETGEMVSATVCLPVWVKPATRRGSAQCATLEYARDVLEEWTAMHARSFPPIVFHFTGGPATDGDLQSSAEALRQLRTDDGHVLLFHSYFAGQPFEPVLFPTDPGQLPDAYSRRLFETASPLPEQMAGALQAVGRVINSGARGLAVNGGLTALFSFLSMGTRPTSILR